MSSCLMLLRLLLKGERRRVHARNQPYAAVFLIAEEAAFAQCSSDVYNGTIVVCPPLSSIHLQRH